MAKYDFNALQSAALKYFDQGDYRKAARIYIFMADGDPSLDGGYLGERLGQCYERMGELNAAKYWYRRAFEENPEVRLLSKKKLSELSGVDVKDIVGDYLK